MVSKTNIVIWKLPTIDKGPWIDLAICFYKVEDDDKYDSGINTLIYVKIYKSSTTAMENTNNMNLPMI